MKNMTWIFGFIFEEIKTLWGKKQNEGEDLSKLFWSPYIDIRHRSYDPDKSTQIYTPTPTHPPKPPTHTHTPTHTSYLTETLNCTFTHYQEQLCQIILKFIHRYRSYVSDKSGCMDTQNDVTMSRSPQVGSTKN